MPIIPLLKKPGPIANAPAAVLDNQRRPNVDNRSVQRAVGELADSGKMPLVDARAAAAPYEALGAVGEAVMKAGGVMAAAAQKRQEMTTAMQVMEADTALRVAHEQHNSWMEKNPDPTGWEEHLQKTLTEAQRGIMAKQGLTPGAKDRIAQDADRFTRLSVAKAGSTASIEINNRVKDGLLGKFQTFVTNKDYEGAEGVLQEGQKMGLFYDHVVAQRRDFIVRSKQADKEDAERATYKAKADAFNSAQNAAVGLAANRGETAAIKDLDDGKFGPMDNVEKEKVRNAIQSVARDRAAMEIDQLSTGILTGSVNSDAAVDAVASVHLSPLLRAKAKELIRGRDADAERKDREENGVRNAVEMRQKVKDYNPATDKDRTGYFTLLKEVGARVEQSSAGEITGELYRKYGTAPPKLETRPEIRQNVSKSLDVLFDPMAGAIPWRTKVPVLDSKGKPVLDYDGNPKTKIEEDPKQQQSALNAQTVIEMKMNDWFRDNPDKANNLSEVQKKLGEVLPEGTRAGALGALKRLSAPAVRESPPDLGAQGAVGPAGMDGFMPAPTASRVTSYGYRNDETPDSNSSAGIGAFVPEAEQEKIKRGEDSPYKLKENDFAVSRDVEKSMRQAGIRPGDEVEVVLADGTTQTGRWMDRTADEWPLGSGKKVTGRWDFYRAGKSDKHPNEAAKVTSFRRA